jgi:hypothetical protein
MRGLISALDTGAMIQINTKLDDSDRVAERDCTVLTVVEQVTCMLYCVDYGGARYWCVVSFSMTTIKLQSPLLATVVVMTYCKTMSKTV